MSQNRSFALESLEPRKLLSVSPAGSHMGHAPAASGVVKLPFPIPASFGLTGTAAGTYTRTVANPDTGAAYAFSGTGSVKPLGATTFTGTLRTPGFIFHGVNQGTITLSNSKGSVTVSLTGQADNSSAAATSLQYSISGGTGAYKSLLGTGKLTLTLQPAPTSLANAGGLTQTGAFTATFFAGFIPLA